MIENYFLYKFFDVYKINIKKISFDILLISLMEAIVSRNCVFNSH